MDHSTLRGCRKLAALLAIALSACGGGGGGGTSSAPAATSTSPPRPVEQSDLQIAEGLYGNGPRTPAGFYSDPVPAGQSYVATVHLKNADIDAAGAAQPLHELCTDDWNQALSWSESSAQSAPQYADLVETGDDNRYFEFGRVRAGDPAFYVRSRIFKCAYLDRAEANLRVATGGPAGQLNQRPLTAAELRTLAEYLWQFTTYNNVGHIVLKSSGAASNEALTHTLHMGTLVRGALSSSCDRIDVVAWRHTMNALTGQLQLQVETLWSFGARDSAGSVALCAS